MELFNFKENVNLNGFDLIIPTVSVGNVPQLTIDLLVTSLNLKKVATLWHPGIISSVGADAYDSNSSEICTACELYIDEKRKLALLQLRSALHLRLATKFFADLKEELLRLNLGQIVILTSSFDYELHTELEEKFYFISTPNINDLMEEIGVKPQKEYNGKYQIHGSGFAVKLYETLKDDFKCTILIKYVSEGDNRPDAIAMISVLSRFMQSLDAFDLQKIRFPCSWNNIFGGPPPLGMF